MYVCRSVYVCMYVCMALLTWKLEYHLIDKSSREPPGQSGSCQPLQHITIAYTDTYRKTGRCIAIHGYMLRDVYTYMHVHVRILIHVRRYVCIYIYVCVYIHRHIHTHTHTKTYIYIQTHAYTCVHMQIRT